ncbi:MAG: hypothetical protein V3T72_18495, partial [Thermoanaerobaculia bacterium]
VSGGDAAMESVCTGWMEDAPVGGGGGRASIHAGLLLGFDPGSQVKAWGGGYSCDGQPERYFATPGTIYYADSSSTYGTLLIDRGEDASGTDRSGERPEATELPALGTGTVSGWEIAGSDAWLAGTEFFHQRWAGAWVKLTDAAGGDLGTFEVIELATDGGIRIAEAGGVSGAMIWEGLYRFDAVELRNGAGLLAADAVAGVETLVFEGESQVSGDVSVATVVVKSGARVTPANGGTLRFRVSGKMTVEPGAVLDVTGLGYSGGVQGGEDGSAPSWVEPSRRFGPTPPSVAGGSHGGKGSDRGDYPAGEVYGSLYRPGLGGGGGTGEWVAAGGAGGGVI